MTDRLTKLRGKKKLRAAGLMSGTSCDGVDVAIVDITGGAKIKTVAFDTVAYPQKMRNGIMELCSARRASVDDVCRLNFLVGDFFARALLKIMNKNGIARIDLIGSHGQTVRHLPPTRKGAMGATWQIGEPSVIAEKTGAVTVGDFRCADIAAGGQGAPLVPYFDWKMLASPRNNRVALNIGGIANITWLKAGGGLGDVVAFDTGPGNMIIDYAVDKLTGGKKKFDRGGKMALGGFVDVDILEDLMVGGYFNRRWPKTAGREQFGREFTEKFLKAAARKKLSAADTVCTAAAFTAMSIADAIWKVSDGAPSQVIVSGGGVHNTCLIKMLARLLEDYEFVSSGEFMIDPDAKEAICFAMLAREAIFEIPSNVPSATGARRRVISGKIIL